MAPDVTTSDDEEFKALIESAYSEPLMVTGAVGDDDMTPISPAPTRDGVDLGVAGSLIQARERVRDQRRQQLGPLYRDRMTVIAALILLACAVVLGLFVGGLRVPGPGAFTVIVGGALLAGIMGAGWILAVRHGPTTAERTLSATIAAEQRAARELTAALSGSSWMLLHDRRLPGSEHRVPFIAVGPAGVALIAIVPAGPYLILAPSGVKAGEDELAFGWLPARVWEARYLMRQLYNIGSGNWRFTGPVIPIAAEGFPRAPKIPAGWSAQPPYRIDQYQIRRPTILAQYLTYLPRIFAPAHVELLARLIDEDCPAAPVPHGSETR